MDDLQTLLESAKQTAREAGSLVRSHLRTHHEVERKSRFDFVTEVDRLSEEFIRSSLSRKYPDHLFFGEEEISSRKEAEDSIIATLPPDKCIWVVDPVDGTTNFIRGIPQFGISIALVKGGEVLVGAVYDVSLDELYSAKKGGGAFLNDSPIHVSSTNDVLDFIISTSFPAANLVFRHKVLEKLEKHGDEITSLRIWNCASLAVVAVACGRTDAHIEPGIHLWDFSAGKLIVEEAGGMFTDLVGKPFSLYEKHVLASNGKCHDKLLQILQAKE